MYDRNGAKLYGVLSENGGNNVMYFNMYFVMYFKNKQIQILKKYECERTVLYNKQC